MSSEEPMDFPPHFPVELKDDIFLAFMDSLSVQCPTWQALLLGKMQDRGGVQVRRIINKKRYATPILNAKDVKAFVKAVLAFEEKYCQCIHGASIHRTNSTAFDRRHLPFGNISSLEICLPSPSKYLTASIPKVFELLSLQELTLNDNSHNIMDVLDTWAPSLGCLRKLWIKYIISYEKNGAEDFPWNSPSWTSSLSKFPTLQVFSVTTPLSIVVYSDLEGLETHEMEQKLVEQWTVALPCIKRVYLTYAYDDDCFDEMIFSRRELFEKMAGIWIHYDKSNIPPALLEEFDYFASDEYFYDEDVSD